MVNYDVVSDEGNMSSRRPCDFSGTWSVVRIEYHGHTKDVKSRITIASGLEREEAVRLASEKQAAEQSNS
jgi:hypothetical protein